MGGMSLGTPQRHMLGVEVLTPLILNFSTRCTLSGQLHTLALFPVPTEQEAEWGAKIGLLRKQVKCISRAKNKTKISSSSSSQPSHPTDCYFRSLSKPNHQEFQSHRDF